MSPSSSGPGLSPVARSAVDALRLFGDEVSRNDAAVLLSMWSRRRELSPRDRLAVLDVFGPAPVFPPHTGYSIGIRRECGGPSSI